MSLDNVLTELDTVRDTLVSTVNEKGAELTSESTLYEINAAIAQLSGGGGSTKFYKCASVDTTAKTWTGYELILTNGVYVVSETETTGLVYGSGFTPVVDKVYSEDGLLELKDYYQGFLLVSPTDMASNETDEWLISASSYSAYPYYAFDGNTITPSGWRSGDYTSPPHWIQWQNKLRKSKILSYSLQASNDTVESLTPNTWVLYGSNNGSDWKIVDERTNAISEATNFETFTFTCSNPEYFYYYKLYVTEPLPRAYVRIGQIQAYGTFE